MKTWSHEAVIDANIEKVWQLFNGSLEDMQKVMPNVIENELVKEGKNNVGTVYRQKYQEGKRVQEYEVKTLEYENEAERKRLKVGFNLANMFDITAKYELEKLEEHQTLFKYTTTNNPLKWYIKPLVKLASNKVVVQFVDRVKEVAEAEEQ
ncbi:SRPBCC family protein [Oceanobacillus piezotolerans]|uniref:SRPBCC family protein n=1 Tax=Oceanobacillus piezotolerans TaxID=2448030 RepID=A0A498D2Z8_9BACI|nr:SRPBCC family protein [Oceanobacillus piezotolerans]RLL42053.1 SRPBCC family protein [Oceanobacillus piezotolerans]